MAIITFAAIDVGSYEVSMNVYEVSRKYGIRQIDEIRSRLEIGRDTYRNGKISYETADELCKILADFARIMEGYQVHAYRACATSTLGEAKNVWIVLEQVHLKTGIEVEVLSNSQQRFYGYKSIAYKEKAFLKIIQKGTGIIEIGGGNVQVSLFDKDALVTTQNFKMGSLRIRERLLSVEKETVYYEKLVEELVHNDVLNFKKLHLKDRKIDNIILLGDGVIEKAFSSHDWQEENRTIDRQEFMQVYEQVVNRSAEQTAVSFGISAESASLMIPTLIIYRIFMEEFGAQTMWIPGTLLNDGLVYDFAEKNKLISANHNFENDIIVSAKNIAKRYMSNKSHTQEVEKAALAVFDGMKKVHGLGSRERLLLQIAVILHDCGKYISLSKAASCSYGIIMSTEIIGLSHREREMIANIVRFNTEPFQYYGEETLRTLKDKSDYMLIGKLTAILRVANALDRSHNQKLSSIKASVKERNLIISIETENDLTLETGALKEKAELFEEVFSIRPVLHRRKKR